MYSLSYRCIGERGKNYMIKLNDLIIANDAWNNITVLEI